MKPDWILVANAAQARLFEQKPGHPMAVLQAFDHPESRLHSSDLGNDERGRQQTDRRAGAAAYQARVEPQRKEHLRFASELADYLEQGARNGRCRHIHLVAASPFLGELKGQLGDSAQRLLAGSHDLDLSAVGPAEIERRVQQAITRS